MQAVNRCPFCGSDAEIVELVTDEGYKIECVACTSEICPLFGDEILITVEAWQQRPVEAELREQLVSLLYLTAEQYQKINLLTGAVNQLEAALEETYRRLGE